MGIDEMHFLHHTFDVGEGIHIVAVGMMCTHWLMESCGAGERKRHGQAKSILVCHLALPSGTAPAAGPAPAPRPRFSGGGG